MAENIWSLVLNSFLAYPEQAAWIRRGPAGSRATFSYRQIHDSALALAAVLRGRGIERGDRVGIMAPNGPHWAVAALAVWRTGAVVAPIHIGNSDTEISAQIAALDPVLILAHKADADFDPIHNIELVDSPSAGESERNVSSTVDGDDEAVRLYTSGSTGTAKMVRLSHRNVTSNVIASSKCVPVDNTDRFLSLLPLSHALEMTAGMLLPLYCGATIVLPRVLAANEIMLALKEERITAMIAVPRLYRNIMQGLEKRFGSAGRGLKFYVGTLRRMPLVLRTVANAPIRNQLGGRIKCWVSGGSRLDPQIMQYFHRLGLPLRQGYGLTETSPVVSFQDAFDDVLDTVGRPLAGVEVRINDPDENGAGELWVRGDNVMLGYVDPGQTSEVITGEGWFRTGDLAVLDESGRITLTGRSKRLIVTEAGKNVYPEELETLLERFAGVKEAGVIEVDMRPAAVLAVEGDAAVEVARDVLKAFNQAVSGHNQINRFAIVDELPRTPLGKIALKSLPAVFAASEVTRPDRNAH